MLIEKQLRNTKTTKLAHSHINFLSLPEYLSQAESVLKQHLVRFCRDEDAISFIAERLIRADWRFNEKIGIEREKYREWCGYVGVKELVARHAKIKNKPEYLFNDVQTEDFSNDGMENLDYVFKFSELNEFEIACLIDYYTYGKTFKQIGLENKKREVVISKVVKSAIDKIRQTFPNGL